MSPRHEDERAPAEHDESGHGPAGPDEPGGDRAERVGPRDPEGEAHVSHLLAAAADRPGAGMPQAVADRLDGVLADLVAERAAGGAPVAADQVTGVTELASRRRRWAPRLLVAAASVSVLALGIGVAVEDLTGSGGDSAMTSGAGEGQQERAPDARDRADAPQLTRDGTAGADVPGNRSLDTSGSPARLRMASLRADVQRVEDAGVAAPVSSTPRRWREACAQPTTGAGDEWAPVRLDGEPGVVVLRAPAGGRRTAEVFACGRPGSPVASTTVEAR